MKQRVKTWRINKELLKDYSMSELLRLALSDLDKVERDGDYDVYMGNWHMKSTSERKCYVCLAGSILAKSFEHPKDKEFRFHYRTRNQKALSSLMESVNYMRIGALYHAFDRLDEYRKLMGYKRRSFNLRNDRTDMDYQSSLLKDIRGNDLLTSYQTGREQFLKVRYKMADVLEREGL